MSLLLPSTPALATKPDRGYFDLSRLKNKRGPSKVSSLWKRERSRSLDSVRSFLRHTRHPPPRGRASLPLTACCRARHILKVSKLCHRHFGLLPIQPLAQEPSERLREVAIPNLGEKEQISSLFPKSVFCSGPSLKATLRRLGAEGSFDDSFTTRFWSLCAIFAGGQQCDGSDRRLR